MLETSDRIRDRCLRWLERLAALPGAVLALKLLSTAGVWKLDGPGLTPDWPVPAFFWTFCVSVLIAFNLQGFRTNGGGGSVALIRAYSRDGALLTLADLSANPGTGVRWALVAVASVITIAAMAVTDGAVAGSFLALAAVFIPVAAYVALSAACRAPVLEGLAQRLEESDTFERAARAALAPFALVALHFVAIASMHRLFAWTGVWLALLMGLQLAQVAV